MRGNWSRATELKAPRHPRDPEAAYKYTSPSTVVIDAFRLPDLKQNVVGRNSEVNRLKA